MLSLASVFILAAFCANAVVRDRETRMEEIVFTTSVGKFPFLVGRFTGSFLAAFTAFGTSALGMFVATFMPWQEPERIGAVSVTAYLWPLAVIALPNMLFAAVLLFALATVTRSVLASYAGSVLLYVLYFIAATLTNSPLMASSVPGGNGNASLASLLDPFALSAFFAQTEHWVPALRNTKLLSLSGDFLLNRILWMAVSLAILGVVYRLFSFRVLARARKPLHADDATSEATPAMVLPHTPVQTRPSQWASYLSITRIELRTFLLTPPFLAMAILWTLLALSELVGEVKGGEYGSALYPASGILFAALQNPLTLLVTILLIYTSTELVWRERSLGIAAILNSTPTSNGAFVAAKCTALAMLVGAFTALGIGVMVAIQLAKGWSPEPGLLLAFACVMGAPLLLFACAAVFVQTVSAHKYLGMLLTMALAVISIHGPMLGLDHRLLRFGAMSRFGYSAMNGFGAPTGFPWLILYWSALTGLLLLLAAALWRHGSAGLPLLRPILRGTSRSWRLLAGAMTIILAASGAFIFYNTNVLHAYETEKDVLDWKGDYETTYKAFASLPQPRIVEIRASVDLYPVERRYRVRGEYVLVNDTGQPIDRVLIAVRREAVAATIAMPSARATLDARFHQHLFRLQRALQPSEQTTVRFDITYANPGFESGQPDQSIVSNGSYIPTNRAFPTIGYRASYEIDDARERRRRGLPASSAAESSREHERIPMADWVRFDVTVSTSPDQRIVAPGLLVRSWEHDGRRSFRFRSEGAMPNQFIIASARYAVAAETHHGVRIEIYYQPGHAYNVARMMRAAAESLQVFRTNFGPYRHSTLRLAEVPAHNTNFAGFAEPGVIFFSENRGLLTDARDPERLDLVYRRVAHEVAHQWWGYTVIAADVPGDLVLTETLTKYSELIALEKARGREQARQLLTYELDLYLAGRTAETGVEPPLTAVENQSYLYYRKGILVMGSIRDLLGEPAVNAALRSLVREQGGPAHSPTCADLLRHLRAAATPEQSMLIDQWMNDVVLYDFQLNTARARRLPNGRYEVRMRVSASKDSRDRPLRFRESIDIGVFGDDERLLSLAKYALHDGDQEIVVIVDKQPRNAVVDPYVNRMDRNRFDNGKIVEVQ